MKNPFKDLFKKKNKEGDTPKPGITGTKKKTSFFDWNWTSTKYFGIKRKKNIDNYGFNSECS